MPEGSTETGAGAPGSADMREQAIAQSSNALERLNAHPRDERERPERSSEHGEPGARHPGGAALDERNGDPESLLDARARLQTRRDREAAPRCAVRHADARPIRGRARPRREPPRALSGEVPAPGGREMN